jgi:serine/threonine protein phosphatase PrpC
MANEVPDNFENQPFNEEKRHLQWRSTAATELGYVRSVNEDAHLDAREHCLWVVADGMGGHSFGDEASRTIIDQLVSFTPSDHLHNSVQDIHERLLQAHSICRQRGQGKVMGSTVAALYVHDPYCFFLWVGDSRIYRLRGNTLEQMTEDHSFVQELVTLGEIRKEEMEQHPSSHIITRAVGVHDDLQLAIEHAPALPGDRYLICSDGLYKDVSEDEIAEAMNRISIDDALKTMVDLALDRGGRDNTTAIVVQAANA